MTTPELKDAKDATVKEQLPALAYIDLHGAPTTWVRPAIGSKDYFRVLKRCTEDGRIEVGKTFLFAELIAVTSRRED